MTDVAYTFKPGTLEPDITLDGPDLAGGKDLETAITISLFTNRRAEVDDSVDGSDRMGWWADTFNDIQNDKIGSRLWLLEREKETNSVLNRAREYIEEALLWMTEDGVADRVEVTTEWIKRGVMAANIAIQRPQGVERFSYEFAWQQLLS